MKIAFLFLIVNDIYFPEIWDYYFKGNKDKVNILCHAKNPENIKTKWLKNNIIKNIVKTKWGHFTNAIVNLLKSALENKDNQKFILISESCLPIKSFNNFYNMLLSDDINTSYIKVRKFDNYNINKSNIQKNFLKDINLIKHSGWFCLSRHHVKKLLVNKNIYKFNNIIAGDEHILSLIYPSNNIKDFEITYSNWEHNKYYIENINKKLKILYDQKESENTKKYDKEILELRIQKSNIGKHPKTYDKITENELSEIKKSKSFFFRKFSKYSNITSYYKDFYKN
jgi:hypothetical protein